MKTENIRIVLMSVDRFDRRDDAELMEGQIFESEQDFLDRWTETAREDINIYTLSDFMDFLNDEEIVTNNWVTYIVLDNPMEGVDKNKLIANFMGDDIHHPLLYNLGWGQLMPVVEKLNEVFADRMHLFDKFTYLVPVQGTLHVDSAYFEGVYNDVVKAISKFGK